MEDYEKDAVFALFVKSLNSIQDLTKAKEDREEAEIRYREAQKAIHRTQTALEVFLDLSGSSSWRVVLNAIGRKRFSDALALANYSPTFIEEALKASQHADEDEELSELAPLSELNESEQDINIKTLVWEKLKNAADRGITARQIIDALRAVGVEMHDKTVGMNLYRLSQEGLARRHGRTWFPVLAGREETSNEVPSADIFE